MTGAASCHERALRGLVTQARVAPAAWSLCVATLLVFTTACIESIAAPEVPLTGAPPWLPPYTGEQLALLAPLGEAPDTKAVRAYPDGARFHYAADRVLDDPTAAMRSTKLVTDLVAESTRLYLLSDISPDVENRIAQYGPPPAPIPDASDVATRDYAGRLILTRVVLSTEADDALKDGMAAFEKESFADAERLFNEAITLAPEAMEPRLRLGETLLRARKFDAAEKVLVEALRVDPSLATAQLALATARLAKGDVASAKENIAQALAYHPDLKMALVLAEQIRQSEGAPPVQRVDPYRIFLEVDTMGVVRVGSEATSGARMYAGCRALMRYELELRAALFDEPEGAPYFLSAAEELFCVESAIGAYLADRAMAAEARTQPPEDDQTATITAIAHTEGLLGFIMFEIFGRHRPDIARTAPGFVHRAMVHYAKRHILGFEPNEEDELRTASR